MDIGEEQLFKVLAGETVEAKCSKCGVIERIVPLEGGADETFLANYHCDDCDR